MKKTTIGTNCFPSKFRAELFYANCLGDNQEQFEVAEYVKDKIKAGEITIGKPLVKTGQKLLIIDNRYHIQG